MHPFATALSANILIQQLEHAKIVKKTAVTVVGHQAVTFVSKIPCFKVEEVQAANALSQAWTWLAESA